MSRFGMRGCPVTGKMTHQFDKVTHQCKCGRWERGFAPAKTNVKPRAECQLCERIQAVDAAGRLGHHGYKRPGWGFITGDCAGQGHLPYPATDALVLYLGRLNRYIASVNSEVTGLDAIAVMSFTFAEYNRKKPKVTIEVARGAEGRFDVDHCQQVPSFDQLVASKRRSLETELRHAQSEVTRVEKRIAAVLVKSAG